MEVKTLLEKWKLNHLWVVFEEQNIDELEILKYLSDDQIRDITKNNIGDQIRLKRGIASLEDIIADNDKCSEEQNKKKIRLDLEDEVVVSQLLLGNETASNNTADVNKLPVIIFEEVHQQNSNTLNEGTQYVTPEACDSLNLSTATTETVYSRSSTSSSSRYDPGASCSTVPTRIADFSLESFIQKDIILKALLNKAEKQCLSNTEKDIITDTIMKYMLNTYGKLSIEELSIVAKKIEEVVPKEISSTYFIAPVSKSLSIKHTSEKARGKLVDKQRNLLYLIRKFEHAEEKNVTETIGEEIVEISETAKDSQIWLKKNTEPSSDVIKHWQNSYLLRKTSHCSISDFFELWPILKTPVAPELINWDFKQIHTKTKDPFELESSFDNYFDFIVQSRKACLTARDIKILQLLETELTSDSRKAIQLYLLPALVPPKSRTQIGKKSHWKPSVTEAREGFLLHVHTPGDIENAKKIRIDEMYKKGLTVQPYMIITGASLSNITGALVVINEHQYKCISVLDALDFCFKAFIVLDAKYPFQCKHIWYLLQWQVYELFAKTDEKIPFINDLVTKT